MIALVLVFFLAVQEDKKAEAELLRLAEWAKSQPDTAPGAVGVGDEYMKAAKKFPKVRQKFFDLANEWYAKGWPSLDQFWKDTMRANLRKLFAVPGGGARPIPKGEWTADGVTASSERVRSGMFAAKLPMSKTAGDGFHQPLKLNLALQPGTKEVVVSCWVLSDETTNANDGMKPLLYGSDGKILYATGSPIAPDVPIWTKLTQTITVTAAVRMQLFFEFQSRRGTVFVDDVEVVANGKPLFSGGFER